jgi:hypothetical protein
VLIAGVIAQLEKDWDEPRHANLVERLGRSPAAFASTSGAPISPTVVGKSPTSSSAMTTCRARRRPGQSPLGQRSSTRAANDNRR